MRISLSGIHAVRKVGIEDHAAGSKGPVVTDGDTSSFDTGKGPGMLNGHRARLRLIEEERRSNGVGRTHVRSGIGHEPNGIREVLPGGEYRFFRAGAEFRASDFPEQIF